MNPTEPSDTSQKQLTANQSNAKKSTGPKTSEGKAKSSQNARKHGFTASTFAVIRIEDLDEVANLKSDLIQAYAPKNSQELFALERLALSQQSLLRLARLEAGLLTAAFDIALNSDQPLTLTNAEVIGGIEITRAQNRNHALAAGFHQMNSKGSRTWELFLRYQAQAERQYRRAVEEFERVKKLRPDIPNEPIQDPQPEETKPLDPPADPAQPEQPQYVTQVMRNEQGKIVEIASASKTPTELRNLGKLNV